jgi:hypothetical protein
MARSASDKGRVTTNELTRRDFLKGAAVAAGTLAVGTRRAAATPLRRDRVPELGLSTTVRYVTRDGHDGNSGRTRRQAKATIEAALAALPSAGGRLLVGPGDFSKPLGQIQPKVPSVTIEGQYGETTLKKLYTATPTNVVRLFAGADGWTLRNLVFDNNDQDPARGGLFGANDRIKYLELDRCIFRGPNVATNIFLAGLQGLLVHNCKFEQCGIILLAGRTAGFAGGVIERNVFDSPTGGAVSFRLTEGADLNDVAIRNNAIRHGAVAIGTSSANGWARGVNIEGNQITAHADPGGTIVEMLTTGAQTEGWVITRNSVFTRPDTWYVMEVAGVGHLIEANNLSGPVTCQHIRVYGSRGVRVVRNQVLGYTGFAISLLATPRVRCDDAMIRANTLVAASGVITEAIQIGTQPNALSLDRAQIVANEIRGSGAAGARGISITRGGGTIDGTLLRANRILGTDPDKRIFRSGDTNTMLSDNVP